MPDLLTDAQLCNDCTVALDVLLSKVVEQTAALADHLVHAQTAVVVVGMNLEVSGELLDALGEDSDLDLGRAGVVLVGLVRFDNCGPLVFGNLNDTPFTVFIFPMSK